MYIYTYISNSFGYPMTGPIPISWGREHGSGTPGTAMSEVCRSIVQKKVRKGFGELRLVLLGKYGKIWDNMGKYGKI